MFYDREAWGARPPKRRVIVAKTKRTHCFLHHTTGDELGVADTVAWVRRIQDYHMDTKGWNDVGYSFLVDRFGNVFEGRGWDVAGGHTLNYNTVGHAVCFLGDGTDIEEEDEYAVYNAIRNLFDQADEYAGRPMVRLNHRDVFATACPGDELADWLNAGMPVEGVFTPPAPPPPPPPSPVYPQLWDPFMRSESITVLQQRLNEIGYSLAVDSVFGPRTDAALRDFQTKARITVDGIYGPQSEAALLAAIAAIPVIPPLNRYLRFQQPHMRGDDVAQLQQQLINWGYNLGVWGADGDFGDWTLAAVRQFQIDHGLGLDGIVGPQTWNALWGG